MAQLMKFQPHLQEAVDAGCLSVESAWHLHWEISVLTYEPWTPGMQALHRLVELYHLPVAGMPVQ